MKRTAWSSILVACFLVLPQTAEAQGVILAPELAIGDNVDFGIGGRALFGLSSVNPALQGAGFITLFFPDNFDYFELGGTLYYRFVLPDNPGIVPKVGAGATVGFSSSSVSSPGLDDETSSSNTNVGLHLLGGVEFPRGKIVPYGQFQVGIGDIPDFAILLGVGFAVGGGGGGGEG